MFRKNQRHCVRRLVCEQFEARLCLSAVSFASHTIITSDAQGASSVFAADVDGDGDFDVLSASQHDDKIAWYENTDGQGAFAEQQVISASANRVDSVYAVDLDGDGDQDVLSASSYRDGKIAWYENTDGNGSFAQQRAIGSGGVFHAADLDGDGDTDILAEGTWYENTDGKGTFGPQRIITTPTDGPFPMYVQSVWAADLDGDSDLDVLSTRSFFAGGGFVWYENTDGKGTFAEQQNITTGEEHARSLYVADVDGDGDVDVLAAGRGVAWYENTDGKGSFERVDLYEHAGMYGRSSAVYAADVDGDGDTDVLSTFSKGYGRHNIVWYENTDGEGTFGPQQIITTKADGANSVHVADVDGDGDLDVLSASQGDDKIAWYENTDGRGSFGPQTVVNTTVARACSVHSADVDGDGDVDVLSASYSDDKIAWYENRDGEGTFGPQQIITTEADGANSVYATDVDGDGDPDVLSASEWGTNIAWYENTDGSGTFGPQQVVTTEAGGATSVYAADVDGDGDMDALSASQWDNKIAWYENTDGKGTFGPQKTVTTKAFEAESVYAADVDGDGDTDVLSASSKPEGDNRIAWYENTDGRGTFGPQRLISTAARGAWSVYATDLDGDGDTDVLSASSKGAGLDKIAWYENTDGKGTFGLQQVITTEVAGARSVYAADVDGDGDQDVLSASSHRVGKIAWYENTDGRGNFGPPQIITTDARGARSVYAADVDGDGDQDVLSASEWDDKIAWYENVESTLQPGDANEDWQFDQIDIMQVLQGGKYLSGESATWKQGDWNGDGVFDQLDIASALATGNYLQGPYAARAADTVFAEMGT